MQFNITDSIKISGREYDWKAYELKTTQEGAKKGESYESLIGYYSTLDKAKNGIANKMARVKTSEEFDEIFKALKVCDTTIDKIETFGNL